jgi:nitrile hydratase subunit beta
MNWLFNLNYLKSKRTTLGTGESARFAVGERVSIRKGSPRENDSTPYYVRGKSGIVEEICAPFTDPYRTASAGGAPLRTYRTQFSAREVWPELPGASGETFTIRLSEDWLMPLH